MTRPNFYIPNITFWRWDRLTRAYVEVQRKQAMISFEQTENALAQLDEDVRNIEQEIKGAWASANVQIMRAFQARLKEVSAERRRIEYVRFKLRSVLDRMNAELAAGRIKV